MVYVIEQGSEGTLPNPALGGLMVMIPAGTSGYFGGGEPYRGEAVATFKNATLLEVVSLNDGWYQTVGTIPGCPDCPEILLRHDQVQPFDARGFRPGHDPLSAARDRRVYELAKAFLCGIEGITPEMIDLQATPELSLSPQTKLSAIYLRLLKSAQNSTMMPRVIGDAIGGVQNLGPVLCDFDPKLVAARDWSADHLFDQITTQLRPSGQLRRGPRSLWPRFCRAAVTGASFLSQFDSASDFNAWVLFFDNDDRARPALPMLLSHEIDGIGFALACDFLKEVGYLNFGKPDVYLKAIFPSLDMCRTDSDYDVFKAIVRVARNVGATPFYVDKLFWLIGSGKFDKSGVMTGNRRDEFIDLAKKELGDIEME